MFTTNIDFTGKQANYLKDLCKLRGNVPDKEQHKNFKIFNSYVDAYIVCPLIGYQYGKRIAMGSASDGDVGILSEQLTKRKSELEFVYQIIMLIDEESEPDLEKRINRTFRVSEASDEDKPVIAENMRIFNEYFLGGVQILYEEFVQQCVDDDSYLNRMYSYVKRFNDEQDGEVLKACIDNLLNK